MAIDRGLLQQIANPQALRLPTPLDVQQSKLSALNAGQQVQADALSLEQQKKKAQIEAATHDLIAQHVAQGGDIFDPDLVKQLYGVNPDLAMSLQAQAQKVKESARGEAIQRFSMLNGQPAQTEQVGQPGMHVTDTGTPLDAKVQPIPSPIASGYQQDIPPDPITIPGVNGPDVTLRPQTARQQFEAARAAKRAQAADALAEKNLEPYTLTPGQKRISNGVIVAENTKPESTTAPRTVTTSKGVMQWNPETQKYDIKVGARPPSLAAAATGAAGSTDAKDVAKAIMSGDQPPVMTGLYRDTIKVKAELARAGYNLSTAETDWKAVQKHISTLNGSQQERLRQAITSGSEMLDKIEELYGEWKQVGKPSGYKLVNDAKIGLSKNFPGKAGAIASALEAQIADFTADAGNVYMGGNSPTDHALSLAAKNLNGSWNEETFTKLLQQARTNFTIRKNSILNSQAVGTSSNSPYVAQPQAGPKVGTVEGGYIFLGGNPADPKSWKKP